MKLCWLDIRPVGEAKEVIRAEAVHQRVDAIVAGDVADLVPLPPTVTRVLLPDADQLPDDLGPADVVIVDPDRHGDPGELARRHAGSRSEANTGRDGVVFGRYLEVRDAGTLELASRSARTEAWTVLRFHDATRIPLEIVLAAAADAGGGVITVAADPEEAAILFGVLERGSDGVMLAPREPGDAARLKRVAQPPPGNVDLVELAVTRVAHVGMGERACVDTCSYLRPDEGILVGSHSKGMLLCASETHPLPYMPTRPFRVNAGAIMSYTLSTADRTSYLSELRSGATVLAVDVAGRARPVTVGRSKIETRPLLSIDAVAPNGRAANLIVQHDWHVRLLGPDGAVLNSTELRPGDRVLGHLATKDRHVGYPINELCYEL